MISKTFGAPFGAVTAFGNSGVDSLALRPIVPPNCGCGIGSTAELPGGGGLCARAGLDSATKLQTVATVPSAIACVSAIGPRTGLSIALLPCVVCHGSPDVAANLQTDSRRADLRTLCVPVTLVGPRSNFTCPHTAAKTHGVRISLALTSPSPVAMPLPPADRKPTRSTHEPLGPLQVKSGHIRADKGCLLYPRKRTSKQRAVMSALCQKWKCHSGSPALRSRANSRS